MKSHENSPKSQAQNPSENIGNQIIPLHFYVIENHVILVLEYFKNHWHSLSFYVSGNR
mgnify:CR=1 FL=1